MLRRRCLTLLVALIPCWLVPTGPARAVYPPAIKDDGKFFAKDTLDKANQKIRDLYEKYRKDVVLETYATLSAEQEKKLKEDDKERFFARLALERSREIGLNGIYIVITKKPTYLRMHMDPETQKRAFTAANRTKAIEAITRRFKEGSFDGGLLDGLDAIETALRTNTAIRPVVKPPVKGS